MDENRLYVQELDEVSERICHQFPQKEKCKALNTYVKIYIEKDIIPVATYLILELAPIFEGNLQFGDLDNCSFSPQSEQYKRIYNHIEDWRKIHPSHQQAEIKDIMNAEQSVG